MEECFGASDPTVERRPACRPRINWTLRWLGILLPLFLTYPILPFVPIQGAWWPARFVAGLALWIAFSAALLWRRDWRGAGAITAFYIIVDAWWALLVFGVLHMD